jgi:putative FmdB family regulatory protein
LPLYEYQCGACGRFEVIQKFSDDPLASCPTCGGSVQKLLSAPAIQFKGTGWYITDYARKSSGDGKGEAKTEASTSKDSSGSKDSSSSSKDSSTPGSSPTK